MPDLILRPFDSGDPNKTWSLELRHHDSLGETEYRRIALVSDAVARDIEASGKPSFLFGHPDRQKTSTVFAWVNEDFYHSVGGILYEMTLETQRAFAVTEPHRHDMLREEMAVLRKACRSALQAYASRHPERQDLTEQAIASFVSDIAGQAVVDEQTAKRSAVLALAEPVTASLSDVDAFPFDVEELRNAGITIKPVIDPRGLWCVGVDYDAYLKAQHIIADLYPDMVKTLSVDDGYGKLMVCHFDSADEAMEAALRFAIAVDRVPGISAFTSSRDTDGLGQAGIWSSSPTEHVVIAANSDGRVMTLRDSVPATMDEIEQTRLGRRIAAAWAAGMAKKAMQTLEITAQPEEAAGTAPTV